jgi:hypothetical protein
VRPNQGRRPERKRLGRPGFLTGDRRGRHREFDNRENRLPRVPVQDKRQSLLRKLYDDVSGRIAGVYRRKDGRGRTVVVEDVVVNGLVVPLPLSGGGVQGHHAVGKEVSPFPRTAVDKIARRRPGSKKHPAPLLIHGQAAPRVSAAVHLPFLPFPRIIPELALQGYRVEDPLKFTGFHVVGAHVAWCRIVLLRYAGADDEVVFVRNAGGRHFYGRQLRSYRKILAEINKPPFPERLDERTRSGVQRINPVLHEVQDPFFTPTGIFPVDEATVAAVKYSLRLDVLRRHKFPDLLASRRIQCNGVDFRRSEIQQSIYYDGVAIHSGAHGIAVFVFPDFL